jgi:hypothetical protein
MTPRETLERAIRDAKARAVAATVVIAASVNGGSTWSDACELRLAIEDALAEAHIATMALEALVELEHADDTLTGEARRRRDAEASTAATSSPGATRAQRACGY